MVRVSIDEITRDPSGYLHLVETGQTVLVTRADRAVAEIKPVTGAEPELPRPHGLARGEFRVPDDFDAPLPDDLLDAFEGK